MGSYKESLLLPQTQMPIKADVKEEQEFYYNCDYSKFKRNRIGNFIIHDGPPYANGDIHIGHALNKILKDFIVKFNYFNGKSVEFVPGWDCHGLPIEQQVNLNCKKDNLQLNKDEFLNACRNYAAEQIHRQMNQFKSLGIMADWENRYETMSPEFEAMISRRLFELKEKEFLIQRKKPVYWSWVFQTALAEAEVEYKDKEDLSAYVMFPITGSSGFLVWTTTPWTLPANVALAFNPNEKYVITTTTKNYFKVIVAYSCLNSLVNKGIVVNEYSEVKDIGQFVRDWEAVSPLTNKQSKTIFDEFVQVNQGTGIVHIAPGHGEIDYNVGLKHNLPVIMPVNSKGIYENCGFQELEGLHVLSANEKVLDLIGDCVIATEKITHSYPHCWRSGKPIIFRATDQWFLNLEKLRPKVLEAFENSEFLPKNTKNRMRPMLENRPDWCISRQRLWGVPIRFDLKQDDVDILDVWFDSGLTWNILNGEQADLCIEGNDQHRGWFQSSLWLSVALENKAPYKKVITHGFVVDGEGKKMAKSKGNVVSPNDVVKKYGAEVLRYWVASTDYTSDVTVSNEIIERAAEGHRKLRNTLRYLVANTNTLCNSPRLLEVDQWILYKTNQVFNEVHACFNDYSYFQGLQKLSEYINVDLSSIYMNAIKDRLYCEKLESKERQGAVFALKNILKSILPLVAPLFTYTAQEALCYTSNDIKNIFDLVYQECPKYSSNVLDEKYWKKALNDFHYHFDQLKKQGKVKDTLEVCLESANYFEGIEDWFVISSISSFTNRDVLAEWEDFRIVKSELNKCERCWKHNAENDLCPRCQKNI